jgi:hypothetical protein
MCQPNQFWLWTTPTTRSVLSVSAHDYIPSLTFFINRQIQCVQCVYLRLIRRKIGVGSIADALPSVSVCYPEHTNRMDEAR